MASLFEQLFILIGRVAKHLLDWPFLLFILLVWIASRYRDQIGSFLDRRAAIKPFDLSAAVRKELEPIIKELGDLQPAVADLQTQLLKLESRHSDYRLAQAVEPVEARVRSLEEALQRLTPRDESLSDQELHEKLWAVTEPIGREVNDLKAAVEKLEARVAQAESKADLEGMRDVAENLASEQEGLKRSLEILRSEVESLGDNLAGAAPVAAPGSSASPSHASGPVTMESAQYQLMKQALKSKGWKWRRVATLAKSAGLSEDEAVAILEKHEEITVTRDEKGRRIAKLEE